MHSSIFSTRNDAINVSHIVYVSPLWVIPKEKRADLNTHMFKIVTSLGATYCRYYSLEAARKARGALYAMMREAMPNMYTHDLAMFDPARVVSIGSVFELSNPIDDRTHAISITLDTADEKHSHVMLRYKSEDNARRGRRILWAVVGAAYDSLATTNEEDGN